MQLFANPPRYRQARDGNLYTKEEFEEYYGIHGGAMWEEAAQRGAVEPARIIGSSAIASAQASNQGANNCMQILGDDGRFPSGRSNAALPPLVKAKAQPPVVPQTSPSSASPATDPGAAGTNHTHASLHHSDMVISCQGMPFPEIMQLVNKNPVPIIEAALQGRERLPRDQERASGDQIASRGAVEPAGASAGAAPGQCATQAVSEPPSGCAYSLPADEGAHLAELSPAEQDNERVICGAAEPAAAPAGANRAFAPHAAPASNSDRDSLPAQRQPHQPQPAPGAPWRTAGIIALSWRSQAPNRRHPVLCVCLVSKRNGQLGFPKGRREIGDRSALGNAKREWREETNLADSYFRWVDDSQPLVDKWGCSYFVAEWHAPDGQPGDEIERYNEDGSWDVADDPDDPDPVVRACWMPVATARQHRRFSGARKDLLQQALTLHSERSS